MTYPAAMYRVTEQDGLRTYSMMETPPVIVATVRNENEAALLKRHGYYLVERDPSIRGGIYARGRYGWLIHWVPVKVHHILWSILTFLYSRPIIGVKNGIPAGVELRLRDLRPFPFGKRVNW